MAVTKRLRYEVLRRDNYTCRYCGASAPDVKLTVDHVVPQVLGGSDEPSNLVTACDPCNNGKTSVPTDASVVADVEKDALRWSVAMEKAATLARADYEARSGYRMIFRDSWDEWKVGPEGANKSVPLDSGWQNSLDAFYEAGLPDWELDEAVRAAMTNQKVTPQNTFRYFAGICWTKIRKMQEQARQIIEAQQEHAEPAIDQRNLAAITERWESAYQKRCEQAGIDYSVEHGGWRAQTLGEVVSALLGQGYSAERLSDAAEEAGHRLTFAVQDYLPGCGDLMFDAMATWFNAWNSVGFDHPAFRSSVPSPDTWSEFKAAVRTAVTEGARDETIISACKEAGEAHLAILIGLE